MYGGWNFGKKRWCFGNLKDRIEITNKELGTLNLKKMYSL